MRNFFNSILDTLFPIRCIGCKKEGEWICQSCSSQIPICLEHVCGVCEKVSTPDGRTCLNCKKKSALSGFVPASTYDHETVASGIHLFKYRFVSELHKPLADLIVSSLKKTDMPIPDMIIPVPLHPRRLRWRGFNQSSLLAAHVSENLLPMTEISILENILVRHRYTSPQMGIKDFQSRRQNLSGAFSLISNEDVKDKIILLVDDVATTGSTIFECAEILKASGAREVWAAVIARQEIKEKN